MQRSMNRGPQGRTDQEELDLDAVVIGAGFAGVYLLYKLRKEGFNVKLIEAGTGLGGIWHWNNYPGARVDSHYPVYALSIPEVYETWRWTEHYPGAQELQGYFRHVDSVLDISKDTIYNTRLASAAWDDTSHKWRIACDNGIRITTTFLNCCLGFAAKRHFPDWPGLEDFKGYMCHSSFWPTEGIELKGKKMAVVGNGATGIQIAQSSAREVDQLGVYVRTPNTCIPMNQRKVDPQKAEKDLETMGDTLQKRFENLAGFLIDGEKKNYFDDPPEVRAKKINGYLDEGGFAVLFSYNDILLNDAANREVWDILVSRTRARMANLAKKNIIAPLEQPHSLGGKRPSLEQDYYEQMDRDHVEIIDLKTNPVSKVVSNGIVTADGTLHEYDIIAIATGFDSLTGGFMEVDFTGIDGEKLADKWTGERGALAYLGIAVHKFPNMFYTYGPLAPTAYGNGPSVVEPQADWIVDVMTKMRDEKRTKIDADEQAEKEWKDHTDYVHSFTLRHNLDSWYMGTNIPGKPKQVLNYAAGIPEYIRRIRESLDTDFKGFSVS